MSRSRSLPIVSLVLLAAGCAPAAPVVESAPAPPPPASARQLVERITTHWADRWYRTLEFRQVNTILTSLGEQRSEWLQRQRVPKRLRIDFVQPQANGSGVLHRDDSTYTFDAGAPAGAAAELQPLQLLSADVPALPVDSTMAALARLRVDTTRFRRDTLSGRPVYVVGAAPGDSTSTQLWVDAERWVLLRLVHAQTGAGGRARSTDYRLTYQEVGGFLVPEEIVFLRDGRPYVRERYTEVRPNVPVDDALFDPAHWAQGVPAR